MVITNLDRHVLTTSTDRHWLHQTPAVHSDIVLSMTTTAVVMTDDTTAHHQPPYPASGFVYHRHQSAVQHTQPGHLPFTIGLSSHTIRDITVSRSVIICSFVPLVHPLPSSYAYMGARKNVTQWFRTYNFLSNIQTQSLLLSLTGSPVLCAEEPGNQVNSTVGITVFRQRQKTKQIHEQQTLDKPATLKEILTLETHQTVVHRKTVHSHRSRSAAITHDRQRQF